LREPETFLDHAPQAVSRHGIARGLYRHGKSYARVREPIGLYAKSKETVVDAPATGVDRVELQLAAKAQLSAKT
jgi:hypothetical protein